MSNVCLVCSPLLIVNVILVITVFFSLFYVFLPFWWIKMIINCTVEKCFKRVNRGCITGCTSVYTMQSVVQSVVQRVASCICSFKNCIHQPDQIIEFLQLQIFRWKQRWHGRMFQVVDKSVQIQWQRLVQDRLLKRHPHTNHMNVF